MTEQLPTEHRLYAFLIKRPRDQAAWAAIYTDRQLAEEAFGRVSPVAEVVIPYEGKVIP